MLKIHGSPIYLNKKSLIIKSGALIKMYTIYYITYTL